MSNEVLVSIPADHINGDRRTALPRKRHLQLTTKLAMTTVMMAKTRVTTRMIVVLMLR